MKLKRNIQIIVAVVLSIQMGFALALGAADAERLRKGLTPVGGEKAASKDRKYSCLDGN